MDAAPEVCEEILRLSDDLDWPYVRENLGRMLSRTRDGVQRVANIVNSLRSLARTSPPGKPPKKEPALLSDLICGAMDIVHSRLRKNHIEIQVEDNAHAKILCMPSQLGQVFLNLLVNAIQAIESVGRAEGCQLYPYHDSPRTRRPDHRIPRQRLWHSAGGPAPAL